MENRIATARTLSCALFWCKPPKLLFGTMPTDDVSSCTWPWDENAGSLRWPWPGNPPFIAYGSEYVGGEQSMIFQTYSARLVRSTPLTDLTKHLDFEI